MPVKLFICRSSIWSPESTDLSSTEWRLTSYPAVLRSKGRTSRTNGQGLGLMLTNVQAASLRNRSVRTTMTASAIFPQSVSQDYAEATRVVPKANQEPIRNGNIPHRTRVRNNTRPCAAGHRQHPAEFVTLSPPAQIYGLPRWCSPLRTNSADNFLS
jgi:hypothetical protein